MTAILAVDGGSSSLKCALHADGRARLRGAINGIGGAAQLDLADNVLLRESLRPAHIKPGLLGHWRTPRASRSSSGSTATAAP